MATADDYAAWIVKNQDKKGSPEFDVVAKAYREAKGSPAPEVKEPSMGSELAHGAGLAVRAGANAVATIPAMLADAVTGVANQFMPEGKKFRAQLPALNELLTKYGIAEPRGSTERVASDVVTAMTGVGASAKAGQYAAPIAKELLTSGIGTQLSAAGLGSLAGGVTRESGGGPTAQLLASLAGSSLPAMSQIAVRGAFPNLTEAGRRDVKGRLLNEAAGEQKDKVLAGLDRKTRYVPGEQPTAAQSAVDAGAPAFAGLEKEVTGKYRPDLSFARDAENEAARLAAVRTVGKDSAALDAATNQRSALANFDYGVAKSAPIKGDPTLAVLLKDPFIKKEIPDALDLMKGRPAKDSLTEFLQYVKIGIDQKLAKTGNDALSSAQQRAAQDAKDNLLMWLDAKNPAYQTARENFAKRSTPINQMEIGQFLEDRLKAPLTGAERPGMFAKSMKELDLSPLTPQQTGILGGVKSSLEREAMTTKQASEGAQKARGLLGENFSPTEPPPLLHRTITVARFALEKIGVSTKNKTLTELARDMQDPTISAKLMREATPSQLAAMNEVIKASALPTAMGAIQGARN